MKTLNLNMVSIDKSTYRFDKSTYRFDKSTYRFAILNFFDLVIIVVLDISYLLKPS